MRRIHLALVAVIVVMSLLAACGGPEEKKAKFYSRAQELLEKGDLVKARLEVKNALQIDPKFAEAYSLLGQIEMKDGDLRAAFGAFSKAVELKPELVPRPGRAGKAPAGIRRPRQGHGKGGDRPRPGARQPRGPDAQGLGAAGEKGPRRRCESLRRPPAERGQKA